MRLHSILLSAMILTLPVGPAAETQPEPPKTLEELQQAARAILDKHKVPGAGLAIVSREGVVWAGGVGKADLAAGRDVTADTLFRTGSVSKTFTALALVKLAEQGRLDLTARLAEVVPEIKVENPWEATHPVRVVHLLEHTAGFDDMELREIYNFTDPPDIALKTVFERFPKPQRVRWPPGTRFAYSNPGYGLAGYVVEKISGRRFEDYVREEILLPLGMTRSDFRLTEENRPLLAQGYVGRPPRPVTYRHIYLGPAGDLKASPAELARLVQMLLNRGRAGERELIRPESLARMERPETTSAARAGLADGYGLALYLSGVESDGRTPPRLRALGHDGGIDGFISSYRYLPDAGRGYVALINSTGSPKALEELDERLYSYVTRGLPAPEPLPAAQLSPAELEAFAGTYEPANPRAQMLAFIGRLLQTQSVFVADGRLYRRSLLGRREELIPLGGNKFRRERDVEATAIFLIEPDGTRVMAAGSLYAVRVPGGWPRLRLGLVLGALALMLISAAFAVVWVPRKLLGRMRGVGHLSVRALPLLAVLSLAAVFFLATRLTFSDGLRTFTTYALYLGTLLFPLLSLAALVQALRALAWEDVHRGVRVHSLLAALACCGIAGYLAYWGLLPLMLWG